MDRFVSENVFGLQNKYKDVMFTDKNFFRTSSQDLISLNTFLKGPTVLTQEKSLMFTQGIEGTFNIVTYMPNSTTDEAGVDQLKSFRIINQSL